MAGIIAPSFHPEGANVLYC
ncbi:MAG: H-X9-DG-CTERM domain-containing protein [Flavobacterium sp.]